MSALAPEIWAGAADTALRRALQINHLSVRARSETCFAAKVRNLQADSFGNFFTPKLKSAF